VNRRPAGVASFRPFPVPAPGPAALFAASLLLLLHAAPVPAQTDFAKIEVRMERMAEGVYMLTGAGGNIGVSVGEDGIFLIDDQYAPLTEKIRAAIAAVHPGPIRFVLNTHWHGDHTGGNENLGKAGAVLIAHDNVRKRMSVEQFNAIHDRRTPAAPKGALPVVTFGEDITLHWNGDDVRALHVPPAHTDGDALVRFEKANVLHMGDCFFNGIFPVIDVSTGGSIDGMIAAADRGLTLADENTKIIPGHGPAGDRAALAAFREMLVTVRERVGALVLQGKSLEEIVAAKPLADLDDPWGKGFMKPELFLKVVHSDLAAKKPPAK
jgi:glyoxylase-like metal-dependent hydrolase (beta-lactamase superfamily II)